MVLLTECLMWREPLSVGCGHQGPGARGQALPHLVGRERIWTLS